MSFSQSHELSLSTIVSILFRKVVNMARIVSEIHDLFASSPNLTENPPDWIFCQNATASMDGQYIYAYGLRDGGMVVDRRSMLVFDARESTLKKYDISEIPHLDKRRLLQIFDLGDDYLALVYLQGGFLVAMESRDSCR